MAEEVTSNLHIIFDKPPGPVAPQFIECETSDGHSINIGTWHKRSDGLWALVIPFTEALREENAALLDRVAVLEAALKPNTLPSHMEVRPGHGYEIYKRDKAVVFDVISDIVTKDVTSELAKAIARLNRSTWDNRVLPIREDVRALLDAYRLLANPEPPLGQCVRYRSWECCHVHSDVAYQGQPGFVAHFGGADIDAPQVDARTWVGLLDEIDLAIEERDA